MKHGLFMIAAPIRRGWKSSVGTLFLSSVILSAQTPGGTNVSYAAAEKSADGSDRDGKDSKNVQDFFKSLSGKFENIKFPTGGEGAAINLDGFLKSGAEKLKVAVESGIPSQVGYGFLMGYSSGFCLKKVSRILAFGLGSIFIVIQTLSYNGYIKVDYHGVQKDIERLLDINKDGKVDEKDAIAAFDKVRDVLEYNMPSGGGFGAGLAIGLRG